ncbi:Lrp/AsnC family transcriptional regulator [Pseudomonas sp. CBSPBW29]|uniref:Lrp/AsnC family transcriptional regulator n=1 Tax=Pseudomonas sp. CBS TaxID=2971912 RepID=UPI0021AC431D|nr:Lrp/AsnC family transcriptional regulator [Pseudomonas sp. CBS]WEL43632.1 Lrp/AsnC family transcriptional regulator [Pseudomonas sp. CBSPBW29]WEL64699.1 Lrp/AsnC family transcriptional regulator [Pseudomonas sp. CBSPGW29]WEL68165.1 Lrp/AsnC family transcriptional regulator [Pseudomonas sp. CBSPCGW29]WEL75184.1 Lrp/AsnC family transcriptional regulator [Pseudomonas sp. CBSPAW29]WEL80570.1 Lrp/AsnC family transcriptional regulator [Pseudomonas sp. CBSPCAW29]WEL89085.1 Lrp/AsnC family transcr
MDRIDIKILSVVQDSGRISITELSKHAGLSIPATTDRLRKLEDAGIISGYGARVDPAKLGYGISAVVGITAFKPSKTKLIATLDEIPEVVECLHVTGDDSYLIRIYAKSMADLECIIGKVNNYGETRTSIVLSVPIQKRQLVLLQK